MCQKERGSGALGLWPASAIVLTKLNPTMWSIKKEILAKARINEEPSGTQYNQPVAAPLFPPNPECSVSDNWKD
jgi:hypothetical protein